MQDTEIRDADGSQGGSSIRKVTSLIGVLLLIGGVAAYAFFVRPMWNDYGSAKADITSKEDKVAELTEKIDSYRDSEKTMDLETEVQKLTLLKSVPIGVNQDEVIEDLVDIAEEHKISLRSVSFGLSDGFYESVGALRINASFEGGYGDLINFLKGIETNSRLFKVTSISVQVSQFEDLDVKKVTFSLSIDAFYQG
jgi:hypothetical protein